MTSRKDVASEDRVEAAERVAPNPQLVVVDAHSHRELHDIVTHEHLQEFGDFASPMDELGIAA